MDEWLFCFTGLCVVGLAGGFLVVAAIIHADMVRQNMTDKPGVVDARMAVALLRRYAKAAGAYGAGIQEIFEVMACLDNLDYWLNEHERSAARGAAQR